MNDESKFRFSVTNFQNLVSYLIETRFLRYRRIMKKTNEVERQNQPESSGGIKTTRRMRKYQRN